MPWIRKDAYVQLVRDLGGGFSEHQIKGTWYGRAAFKTSEAVVTCDLELGGPDALRPEDAIVSTKFVGSAEASPETARFAQVVARRRFTLQLRACIAATNNKDRKLEGATAKDHAKLVVPLTGTSWSIVVVELPKRPKAPWDDEDEAPPKIDYLSRDGLITFLPLA